MDIPGEYDEFEFQLHPDFEYQRNDVGMYKYSMNGVKYINIFGQKALKDTIKLDAIGATKNAWPPHFALVLGSDSLTFKYGNDHRRLRKVLNPLFTEKALKTRYDLIYDATETFLNRIYTETDNNNDYIDLFPIAKIWAWDIGVNVVLGINDIITNEESVYLCNQFLIWSLGMLDYNLENKNKTGTMLGDALISKEILLNYIDDIIERAKQQLIENNLDKNSVIYQLLQLNENDISRKELREAMLLLLWASHDTTASSINNAVYALHNYPKHAEILSDELESMNDTFSYNDLKQCEYLDGFVRESMRFLPNITWIPKYLMKDGHAINGYNIDSGHTFNINIKMQCENEYEFKNHLEFDPNRFISGKGNVPSKYGYTPFGIGSKMCPGWLLALLEMKIMVMVFSKKVKYEIDETKMKKK
eukprot:18564_1